jgi:hypothetical protein
MALTPKSLMPFSSNAFVPLINNISNLSALEEVKHGKLESTLMNMILSLVLIHDRQPL